METWQRKRDEKESTKIDVLAEMRIAQHKLEVKRGLELRRKMLRANRVDQDLPKNSRELQREA